MAKMMTPPIALAIPVWVALGEFIASAIRAVTPKTKASERQTRARDVKRRSDLRCRSG
jgi:hypothetical protein